MEGASREASDVNAVDAVLPLLGLGLDVAKRGELKLYVFIYFLPRN